MKDFLKLIRWQNLLIVALTMILMRYAVISTILNKIDVTLLPIAGNEQTMRLQFQWYDFVFLVLATVMITAGGYIINDYFDIKTDLINKGKAIVGTAISRRVAILWHSIMNFIGVALGFYVSWKIGYPIAGIMFLLVTGLFYFYSVTYKRQFLLGNFIVAFLTAMLPFLVLFYEWIPLNNYYTVFSIKMPEFKIIIWWVAGFSLFAFFTTLIREIIKDIDDLEGDETCGRNTLPVVMGIKNSVIIAVSLVFVTLILLYLIWYFYINDIITFLYLTITVALPLCSVIVLLLAGNKEGKYRLASTIMKVVMLTGLLYSVVAKIIISFNLY